MSSASDEVSTQPKTDVFEDIENSGNNEEEIGIEITRRDSGESISTSDSETIAVRIKRTPRIVKEFHQFLRFEHELSPPRKRYRKRQKTYKLDSGVCRQKLSIKKELFKKAANKGKKSRALRRGLQNVADSVVAGEADCSSLMCHLRLKFKKRKLPRLDCFRGEQFGEASQDVVVDEMTKINAAVAVDKIKQFPGNALPASDFIFPKRGRPSRRKRGRPRLSQPQNQVSGNTSEMLIEHTECKEPRYSPVLRLKKTGDGNMTIVPGVSDSRKQLEPKQSISKSTEQKTSAGIENSFYPKKQLLRVEKLGRFICNWQNCSFSFDSADNLYDHVISDHTLQNVDSTKYNPCLWATCSKNDGKQYISLTRLHRHIKEKHMKPDAEVAILSEKSRALHTSRQFLTLTTTSEDLHTVVQQQKPDQGEITIPNAPGAGYSKDLFTSSSSDSTMNYMKGAARSASTTSTIYLRNIARGQKLQVAPVAQSSSSLGAPNVNGAAPTLRREQTAPARQSAVISDPGTAVVRASKLAEPVFVAPPSSVRVKRVLHSKAYLKYIESLNRDAGRYEDKRSKTVLAYRKNIFPSACANQTENTDDNAAKEKVLVHALQSLRQQLLQDAENIALKAGL